MFPAVKISNLSFKLRLFSVFANFSRLTSVNILLTIRNFDKSPYSVFVSLLATFRVEDKNDYEYQILFKVFSRIVKK